MQSFHQKKCLIITGPTASGKTKLAFDIARLTLGYIINADSMQLYDHLRILTARPSPEELHAYEEIPYHLDGVISGTQKASVGWWVSAAAEHIEKAWTQDKLPIVVGGTGMYLKALMEGISPVPEVPGEIREEIRKLGENHSLDDLQKLLKTQDPHTSLYNDKQRLLRAFEVISATGTPLRQFQNQKSPLVNAHFITLAMMPEREKLYTTINQRFDHMMEEGVLEEVRKLMEIQLPQDHPILGATGYRDLRDYFLKKISLSDAIEKAKQHSRNYAKRQYTWIRGQMKCDEILTRVPHGEELSQILKLQNFLTKI